MECVENLALSYRFRTCMKSKFSSSDRHSIRQSHCQPVIQIYTNMCTHKQKKNKKQKENCKTILWYTCLKPKLHLSVSVIADYGWVKVVEVVPDQGVRHEEWRRGV